ncbi:hypothetical protein R1sor_005954 [Riccia sorocarpa]|uniref:Regulatory protein zeste n=1 Tax=Riccia sorocarpa TaxID=122646 RepID=A0ABD3HLJ7_9MARC
MIPRDYEAVVTYIEEPENFRQVMGGGKKTKVGGKCISKTKAFHIMASHLKNIAGFPDVTGEEMKKRFERYVLRYKKARQFKEATGRGLSEKELESGMTIEEKVEKICPHFDRMHAILGQRANIAPPAEESVGLPEDTGLLVGDSQREEDDSEDWMHDDDNLGEGVTAVEPEPARGSGTSTTSPEREPVYVNLVDADYGSDDDVIPEENEENEPFINLMDDETFEERAEEEENNDTGAQRRNDHQEEENMNRSTQRRSDHRHGGDDEHSHARGRRRNEDVVEVVCIPDCLCFRICSTYHPIMATNDEGAMTILREELSALQEGIMNTFSEAERELSGALRATNLPEARESIRNVHQKIQDGRALVWRSLQLISN